MIRIEIDGTEVEVQQGSMIIEAADNLNIPIPRFCYHKKLSIAANCRMCLVEVEKAPKPLPACATPATEGMKVWTKSDKTKLAQKSVMEFLLVNHPLDCPICDQGGECELQDLSMRYGSDLSRYQEEKRVVVDKNIGPLIDTNMTRCILCTRCIRFGTEVAGITELGATGRGEFTQVGTFIEKNLDSEVSGNVIDLCPVGALISKPYNFTARGWELNRHPGISPHDCLGSNLFLHIRNNKLMRVVPEENQDINEVWLSDRDRFSYEAIDSPERLQQPMIKINDNWHTASWQEAIDFSIKPLLDIAKATNGEGIGAVLSPNSTIEEGYLLQKFMRGLNSNNIDHRLRQIDFRDQDMAPLYPNLGLKISELELQQGVLLVGSYIHKEQPLLGLRLRKMAKLGGKIYVLNPLDFKFNFAVTEKIIAQQADMVMPLVGIIKAVLQFTKQEAPIGVDKILSSVEPSAKEKAIANELLAVERRAIILGGLALSHPQSSRIIAYANILTDILQAKFGMLTDGANSAGAWLAGCVPHRAPGGKSVKDSGKTSLDMLTTPLQAYVLMGIDPSLDSVLGDTAVDTLQAADHVVALSAFKSQNLLNVANVLLPIETFGENSGTYVNTFGSWQSFNGPIKSNDKVRPAWKILRVLADQANLNGFKFNYVSDVLTEIKTIVGDEHALQKWQHWVPNGLKSHKYIDLVLITTLGLYTVDQFVRHSKALQNTNDARGAVAYISPQLAQNRNLQNGDVVNLKMHEKTIKLPIEISELIPEKCIWVEQGKIEAQIGLPYCSVDISISKDKE